MALVQHRLLTFLISFIMSLGSMEEVVFMDQVNLRDLGLDPRGPSLPPTPSLWVSIALLPLDVEDR